MDKRLHKSIWTLYVIAHLDIIHCNINLYVLFTYLLPLSLLPRLPFSIWIYRISISISISISICISIFISISTSICDWFCFVWEGSSGVSVGVSCCCCCCCCRRFGMLCPTWSNDQKMMFVVVEKEGWMKWGIDWFTLNYFRTRLLPWNHECTVPYFSIVHSLVWRTKMAGTTAFARPHLTHAR